jgi:hypothetical protein
MTATIEINVNLWEQFSGVAQQQRKRPNRLLEKLMVEYLAMQEDLQLDDEIRRHVRRNGFKERDAVQIVKRFRKTRKA